MNRLRSLLAHPWALIGVALAVTGGMVLVAALPRASAQEGPPRPPEPPALATDLTKLSIVVMANQTPITQADAQAVLPALEEIQQQLTEDRETGERPDEAALAELDAKLLGALPSELRAAVDAVRLLHPLPFGGGPHGPRGHGMRGEGPPPGAGPADEPWGSEAPRRGRRGGGMRGHDELGPGGPGMGGPRRGMRGGAAGEWMLLPLIDFFRTTAAG